MPSKQRKFTTGKIIALITASILPLLIILRGLLLLMDDFIITYSFAISYFLLPLTALVISFFIICSKIRKGTKTVLCVLFLIAMAILFFLFVLFGHFSILCSETGSDALDVYQQSSLTEMPEISQLGQPQEIRYHSFFNTYACIFDSDCYLLFCKYSDGDYQRQKDQLEACYTFQTETISSNGYCVDPSYSIDGYEFRFLSFDCEEYQYLIYPKSMAMVGTNDSTKEIVYLRYYDDDLDYISSFEEHFLNDFGWKYLR